MIKIRPAEERGHADHGWLNTYHTFSFGEYTDERYMGFRSLRVINDDRVRPGQGFGTHPHRDMEIISYVLEGALEHKDSMGNGFVIRPGDVQRMSAGTGVMHSEFNPSKEETAHFLQIWIHPAEKGIQPGFEQKTFSREEKLDRLRLIASTDGRDGSVTIHQDVNIYATVLEEGTDISIPIIAGRHLWVHIARGNAKLGKHILKEGDGAAVSDENKIAITGLGDSEILIFDLA